MYQDVTLSYAPQGAKMPIMIFIRPKHLKVLIRIVSKAKFSIRSDPSAL